MSPGPCPALVAMTKPQSHESPPACSDSIGTHVSPEAGLSSPRPAKHLHTDSPAV